MCGGTLEIATCSHVGHVFRKSTPYTFPGGTSKIVNRNNARLAEVWLDQWKHFYYNINPGSTNACVADYQHDCFLQSKIIACSLFLEIHCLLPPPHPSPHQKWFLSSWPLFASNIFAISISFAFIRYPFKYIFSLSSDCWSSSENF